MMKTLISALILSLFLSPIASAQKSEKTQQSTQDSGVPKPGMVKEFSDLTERNDTAGLKKLDLLGKAPPVRPRTAHIGLLANPAQDSVVLRWAPTTPGGWMAGNAIGYTVERATVRRDGRVDRGSLVRLNSSPLKPWPLEEWKKRAARDNRFAPIGAQAVHGKTFSPKTMSAGEIKSAVDELTMRFGFALTAADNDAFTADALGLRLVDRSAKAGEKYLYLVHLAATDPSYSLDTAFVIAELGPHNIPDAPEALHAETKDRLIILKWNSGDRGRSYSGYYISRSDDGGKNYHRLNDFPFLTLGSKGTQIAREQSYADTSVVNYKRYRYQVKGVTPFAELSAPAELDTFARDVTPPLAPHLQNPKQISSNRIQLTWEMTDKTPDLAGFLILRSGFAMSGFPPIKEQMPREAGKEPSVEGVAALIKKQLLPPSARTYVDTAASPLEPYYIVGAVDTAGNLSQSLPAFVDYVDTIPPSTPTGFAGAIDSNGIVRLHWNLGPEPGIIGYRIYWANDPQHEFSVTNNVPVKDTMYVDSVNINTLTRDVYYRIAALNARYFQSKLSPILGLRRPDRVPPAAPVFTDVQVSDSAVSLAWAASPSEDLREQILYRRALGDTGWKPLVTFHRRESAFVDRSVTQDVTYEYLLSAVDSSGLVSNPAASVLARPYDNGMRPGVSNLRATYDEATKKISVRWDYVRAPREKYWFVVYRDISGHGLAQRSSVGSSFTSYDDADLGEKGTYRYAIKVFTERGGESAMSTTASVELK
jgi:hypothetical protein